MKRELDLRRRLEQLSEHACCDADERNRRNAIWKEDSRVEGRREQEPACHNANRSQAEAELQTEYPTVGALEVDEEGGLSGEVDIIDQLSEQC